MSSRHDIAASPDETKLHFHPDSPIADGRWPLSTPD
jgi:hypothetical protein